MRTLISYFAVVISCTTLLIAQDSGSNNSTTASSGEDQSSWIRRNVLRELFYSSGRRGKMLVLDRINSLAESSQITPDDSEVIQLLSELARQGQAIRHYDKRLALTNNYVMIRAAAVQVMAKIGGPIVNLHLREILNEETESFVMAEAVKAFRATLPQENPFAVDTLVRNFMRMHYEFHDDGLADVYLNVVKDISENDKKLLDADMIHSIQQVAWDASGYSAAVRNKAISLLLSLI